MKRTPAVLLLAAALAACSGEPSNSDIESALDKHFTQAQAAGDAAMTAMLGKQAADSAPKMAWKINSLKKVGCKEEGGVYQCNVESDIELPMLGHLKQVLPLRLVKASDGWQLVGGFGG